MEKGDKSINGLYDANSVNNLVHLNNNIEENEESIVYPEQFVDSFDKKTNGFAIAGLVVSIFVSAIIGLILSIIGLRKADVLNSGKGIALAGIIVSILKIALIFSILIYVFAIVIPVAK